MGLDMYLTASTYVSGWSFNDEPTAKYDAIREIVGYDRLEDAPWITVETPVLYWRKANAIHRWFVENVQDGEDDCGRYCVSPDKLKELRDECKAALEAPDPSEILPTQSGFFFGSTEYDDYYAEDLRHTIAGIDKVLERHDDTHDLYYRSSW